MSNFSAEEIRGAAIRTGYGTSLARDILNEIEKERASINALERLRAREQAGLAMERSGHTPKGGDFPDGGATTIALDELAAALWLSGHVNTARQNAEHYVRTVLERRKPPLPEYKAGTVVRSRKGYMLMKLENGGWQRTDGRTFPEDKISRPFTVLHQEV
jgi:hypothetical protein